MCHLSWEVSVYMTMWFCGLLKGVEKRERHTGKKGGRCRKVGDRLRSGDRKDVVRTVLQSGPLRLRAVIVVTLCSF